MAKRPSIVDGTIEFPRTFTVRVPSCIVQVSATVQISAGIRKHNRELTVARFVKAMGGVAMRCEYGDLVPSFLEPHGSIDYKTLGTTNAQIRMEEDYVLLLFCHGVWVLSSL